MRQHQGPLTCIEAENGIPPQGIGSKTPVYNLMEEAKKKERGKIRAMQTTSEPGKVVPIHTFFGQGEATNMQQI